MIFSCGEEEEEKRFLKDIFKDKIKYNIYGFLQIKYRM